MFVVRTLPPLEVNVTVIVTINRLLCLSASRALLVGLSVTLTMPAWVSRAEPLP